VARSVRDSATNVIVARKGNAFAGFAILKYEEEEAHLLLMAVASAYRRKRVATAMWQWLEETVRAAGITSVLVETRARNEAALTFYRRLGFEDAGLYPGYYEGVEDARRMVKDLARTNSA
jgi:[ribosomal protein S18]-alanine N-acetyltransferase